MSPRPPVPPTSPTADAVTTQYQRVGHELADLEAKRGADHCADLADSFHEIHLADALATAEGRGDATAALTELHDRIVRWRGVQISADCLANPLAQDCQ
jgi:hypothetical protein